MKHRISVLVASLLVCLANGATFADDQLVVLHLPGIGGHLRIDDMLILGLQQGKITGPAEIYDWTHGNPGVPALAGIERNRAEARRISQHILELTRVDKDRRMILTSHSGGTGMAIWALEDLPDDVSIDTLLMVASAISPEYDLSKALKHVRGHAYALNSTYDWVLGLGTRGFGTIDRLQSPSAGYAGFVMPAGADAAQYAKLVQIQYDPGWFVLGNLGNHIGAMNPLFARTMIAPLILTGKLPALPSTQPSTLAPSPGRQKGPEE